MPDMKRSFILAILLYAAVGGLQEAHAQLSASGTAPVVLIDPANKQNVKGNVSIALAWGEMFAPPQGYLRGFIHLRDSMVRWTKVNTEITRNLMLGSPRLLEIPFVLVTTDVNFELSPTERANVKKYLENGGFLVLENPTPRTEKSPAEASLKQMIRDALGSAARFKPIPADHPIYTCFWDFTDGPPQGSEVGTFGADSAEQRSISKPVYYLEGVWIGERLAVVFSNKGYIVRWAELSDNIPQLKFGVNLIVFSMIQQGGITKRQ